MRVQRYDFFTFFKQCGSYKFRVSVEIFLTVFQSVSLLPAATVCKVSSSFFAMVDRKER